MCNHSKLFIRKYVIISIFLCLLPIKGFSLEEFSVSSNYKVGVIECQNEVKNLLGIYEAEKIFNWIGQKNANEALLDLANKSTLEAQRVIRRIDSLKLNSHEQVLEHFSPPSSPLQAEQGCKISLAARRDSTGAVILNSRVWPRLSNDLKEKAYLELAWSEKIGVRARLHVGYLLSTNFRFASDLESYKIWTGNHVIDQYYDGLHFQNRYSSNNYDRYFNEISFKNLSMDVNGDLHTKYLKYDSDENIKSYGRLVNIDECQPSASPSPLINCGVKQAVDGVIDEGRVKFPHKEFYNSKENCSLDYCSKHLSPTWEVTFTKRDNRTVIDSLTCNSFLNNYKIIRGGGMSGGGIVIFEEIHYGRLYTCNIDLFGQKLEISKSDLVFEGFGLRSKFDLNIKFSENQIELNLPISSDFLKIEKHYYKNPLDGKLYGGSLVINNFGHVVNTGTGAVEIEQNKLINEL